MIYGDNSQNIRAIMTGLADQVQWMELVRDERKEYTKLIDYLTREWAPKNVLFPNVVKLQTLVYYAGELKEKPSTINKWFRQIYNYIFDLNENHPELFAKPDEILCSFIYDSPDDGSGFWFNLGVKSIPRIGDYVSIRFVKAVTDSHDFIVKDVTHRFQNGRMEIEIDLMNKINNTNPYRNLLIQKALYLGLISIDDLKKEWKLDDKLMHVFPSDHLSMI